MSIHQHSTPLPPAGQSSGSPSQHRSESRPPFWRSKTGLVAIAFLLIAAFFLVSEHRAHALGVLPFLLILACPILHLFMHGGHGRHGGHGEKPGTPTSSEGTRP